MTWIETTMTNQQTDASSRSNELSLLKANCDLEYLLMGDIRILLSEKFDSKSRLALLVLLNRLILNLPKVLDLSSRDGYMRSVLEKRPNWSHKINALHQANQDCVATLSMVRDCLKNEMSISAISKDLELRLQKWIESFSALRYSEGSMLQEAFTVDLGGEA